MEAPGAPAVPTEAQKLRANIAVTLFGTLVLAAAIGLANLWVMSRFEAQRLALASSERHRSELNTAIREFAERVPRSLILTYEMSMRHIEIEHMDPARSAEEEEALFARFLAARDEMTKWGDAAGPCLVLEATLDSESTRAKVRAVRRAVSMMVEARSETELNACLDIVNAAWDDAVDAISEEIHK